MSAIVEDGESATQEGVSVDMLFVFVFGDGACNGEIYALGENVGDANFAYNSGNQCIGDNHGVLGHNGGFRPVGAGELFGDGFPELGLVGFELVT